MNFSFWWPVGLVVMAGVGYQVSAKKSGGRRGSAGGACSNISCGVAYIFSDLCVYRKKGREMERDYELPSCCPCLGIIHCIY